MEKKIRSLIKSGAWRIIALLNAWCIIYIFMGDSGHSFFVALIANITGFILYYTHERIWNRIKWGIKTCI